MKLPGFTAEAALSERNAHYASVTVSGAPASFEVVPQGGGIWDGGESNGPFCNRRKPNCYFDCLSRCEDPGGFCEHNCRCCCSGIPGQTCHYM